MVDAHQPVVKHSCSFRIPTRRNPYGRHVIILLTPNSSLMWWYL